MAFKCITLIYFLHQERDDEFCLTIKWMAVRSTGVGVSKMALCLCHSSSRWGDGCHMLVSSLALTSPLFTCSAYSTCKQFAKTLWARWTIPTAWLIFSLRCHLCVIQHLLNWKKSSPSAKACLKTHKGPRRHSAVVYHLCTFIWASDVPFFFRVAWQMPPLNLVLPREWMQLFNEHRSNYHNRETIKEN